ncbi:MAG: Holliday junction resolvase-like protein [Treponema sp.]|nr:hypothetical protein [Spirochaetia bacterium]MDY2839407.1 Holliday junction resolvase-like protein [Treponema sp.]MDY5124363.1 Holliday junction resolvase-like protein [Treponema sp.]
MEYLRNLPQTTIYFIGISIVLVFIIFFQHLYFSKKLSKIRKDAVKRSRSVINGQMIEQVAPFLPDFPCNPSDARFVGKPVDFIAFKGLSDEEIEEIQFIEVKTGQSTLSEREKQIKKAVKEGRVKYIEYRLIQ